MKKAITLIWLLCMVPFLIQGQGITESTNQKELRKTLITEEFERAPDSPELTLEQVSPEFARERFQRIVGGDDAFIEDHPWHAALAVNPGTGWGLQCGAAIIAGDWVVTAAHCVENPDLAYAVFAGGDDLTLSPNFDQMRMVDLVIIYPDYDPNAFPYDIALLKLESDFNLDNRVAAIDIVTEADANGGMTNPGVVAEITGMGCYPTGW